MSLLFFFFRENCFNIVEKHKNISNLLSFFLSIYMDDEIEGVLESTDG
jgi:hypothetical protein